MSQPADINSGGDSTSAANNVDAGGGEMRLALVFERYAMDLLNDLREIDAHEADEMIKQSDGDPPLSRISRAAMSVPRADLVQITDAFEFSKGATAERTRAIVRACVLDSDRRKVDAYLAVLATLCVTWRELRENDGSSPQEGEGMVLSVLEKIAEIQSRKHSSDTDNNAQAAEEDASPRTANDGVVPDDVCVLLQRLDDEGQQTDEEEPPPGLAGGLDSMFESVMGGNSSIGNIARDVAKDIDISKFAEMLAPTKNAGGDPAAPPAMPDIGSLLQNNGIIGEIVSSVSSKISQKMANGELDQNALMSEAIGLMSSLGGGVDSKKKKKGRGHNNHASSRSGGRSAGPDLDAIGSLLGGGGGGMPAGMADMMAKMMQSFTPGRA